MLAITICITKKEVKKQTSDTKSCVINTNMRNIFTLRTKKAALRDF